MPAISHARELWRYGEPELARKAASMTASQCTDVGERAGSLSLSGEAAVQWPDRPRGHTSAILLAVAKPLRVFPDRALGTRRLPEKSLPDEWQLTEEQLWAEIDPISHELTSRLHSNERLLSC